MIIDLPAIFNINEYIISNNKIKIILTKLNINILVGKILSWKKIAIE
jgi:hypothetical protein